MNVVGWCYKELLVFSIIEQIPLRWIDSAKVSKNEALKCAYSIFIERKIEQKVPTRKRRVKTKQILSTRFIFKLCIDLTLICSLS